MREEITVNLGNLVLSLSDAMDLANPSLTQHQQRTAYTVWQMGKTDKLEIEKLEQCFMAALLHDIGALSLEEKITVRNYEVEDTELHCIKGSCLLEQTPWFKKIGKIIRYHHKEWQQWGESIDNPIVYSSQLVFLADFIERQINRDIHILNQNEDIIIALKACSGKILHPKLVDLFIATSIREEFWLDLVSPRLYSILLNDGPFRKIEIELSDISLISQLFRNIIDFRSTYTSTHSSGVAECAAVLSEIFGLTESEVELVSVAGNIHDLGKLVIPNSILEKPGPLLKEELNIIKSHAYYTYYIINSIRGLGNIAEWGAYHHERLDGSGYPFHCKATDISTNARILMVADVFTALSEDRPYRKAMSRKEISRILNNFSERKLMDANIISLLLDNYDVVYSRVVEKQAVTREYYMREFCTSTSKGV